MSFSNRLVIAAIFSTVLVSAQNNNNSFTPRWWAKYQTLLTNGANAPAGITSSAPVVGTGGTILDRSTLTGDWWGVRDTLSAHGVAFDVSLTQFIKA